MTETETFGDLESGVSLYLGDAFEVMPIVGMVDVCITDAPYDDRTHAGHRHVGNTVGEKKSRGRLDLSPTALSNPIDFPPIESAAVARLLLAHARRWSVAFCALEELGNYRGAAGDAWIRAGVWCRDSGPQLSGDRPAQGAEGVAIMHPPGKKRWGGGGLPARWVGDSPRGDDRPEHPTPKPPKVIRRLVELFSDPRELIADPFMGGGETGVQAVLAGRRFIGIEIRADYFAVAVERIKQAIVDRTGGAIFRKQTALFPR